MSPSEFDKQSYWSARFANEASFEWLLSSEAFLGLIRPHIARLDKATARILHLGFGTSDLQLHLRAAGFGGMHADAETDCAGAAVVNVDFAPEACERGRRQEHAAFGNVRMRYVVADATRLDAAALGGPFDLVLDKSTADAVSCAGDAAVRALVRSVRGCLKPDGGVWISLSYAASRFDPSESPVRVKVLARVPTAKKRESDPDIFHWCYLLS
ncbi:hypothetical protein DFJ73DRAFT_621429 [Zopfochytrium polystomum]|nr:hypothetical protein DFJ73DRAFT_621429 [Zopfochytrium polystomum]